MHLQGYEAENPNIELLRLRNFTLGKRISDDRITAVDGLETILQLIGVMVPFVSPLFQLQSHSFHTLQATTISRGG